MPTRAWAGDARSSRPRRRAFGPKSRRASLFLRPTHKRRSSQGTNVRLPRSEPSSMHGANGAGLPVTFWGRVNIWRDFIANPPAATFATLSGLDPTTLDGALEGTWGEIDA